MAKAEMPAQCDAHSGVAMVQKWFAERKDKDRPLFARVEIVRQGKNARSKRIGNP